MCHPFPFSGLGLVLTKDACRGRARLLHWPLTDGRKQGQELMFWPEALSLLSNVNSTSANTNHSLDKNALSSVRLKNNKKSIFILKSSVFYIIANPKVVFSSSLLFFLFCSHLGRPFLRSTNNLQTLHQILSSQIIFRYGE